MRRSDERDDNVDDISVRDFNNTFKSRKALNTLINDRSEPSALRNLKLTANIVLVILLIIAGFDYFIAAYEFDDIISNIKLIN